MNDGPAADIERHPCPLEKCALLIDPGGQAGHHLRPIASIGLDGQQQSLTDAPDCDCIVCHSVLLALCARSNDRFQCSIPMVLSQRVSLCCQAADHSRWQTAPGRLARSATTPKTSWRASAPRGSSVGRTPDGFRVVPPHRPPLHNHQTGSSSPCKYCCTNTTIIVWPAPAYQPARQRVQRLGESYTILTRALFEVFRVDGVISWAVR